MKKIFFLLLIFIAGFSNYLLSQDKSFTFITDQDFFYTINRLKNEDRNYTQGTSFALSNENYYNSLAFQPFNWINGILNAKQPGAQRVPVMSTFSLLGTAFTPRIIDSINPIVGDRPFAFLLAVSTSQINRIGGTTGNKSKYESFTINYGLLGTNVGYRFQSFAHTHLVPGRPKDPKGWDTQISKGGLPTLLFNYERLKCFSTKPNPNKISSWGIDGFFNAGGSIGYYNRLYTGGYIRMGWIDHLDLPTWAFWGNSLATGNRGTVPGSILPTRHVEAFIFSRISGNFIPRDAMLVGQLINGRGDRYTINPSWVNVGVIDIDLGLALAVHWIRDPTENAKKQSIRVLYKNTIRSPEFDSKIFPERWHYFGSFGFQISFD